jgi:cytochrome c5
MTFVTDDQPDTLIPPLYMKTSKLTVIALMATVLSLTACGGGESAPATPPGASGPAPTAGSEHSKLPVMTAADITLGDIDQAMVEKGRSTYDVKCQACHSTSANRVVGPGWKGILERRKPEWIMNMVLNIDVMLETDPEAQKMLEECLVRMPNQNLTKDDAREVLEFMRTL